MSRRIVGGVAALSLAMISLTGCGGSRVEQLEKRVAALEQELAELKGKSAAAPAKEVKTGAALHPDWRAVPLDGPTEKGLKWLMAAQGPDGGWGQDGGREGSARSEDRQEHAGNDVANTSLVALALLRAGNTPAAGPYGANLAKAIEFILSHVENAPADGLAITTRQGTQIQRKLGPYIDTFLASLVLSEVDGQMAGDASKRVRKALEKTVAKIEKHQQADGSWNLGGGWAPVIGTSLASRGLRRAQEKGVAVKEESLQRVAQYTKDNFDAKSGEFKAAAGAGAGVELYAVAQSLEEGQASAPSRTDNRVMIDRAKARLGDEKFLSGFGSMGGEEFVSYLNISDALLKTGGKDWSQWNGRIKEHLVKLQNQDGTWAGHHCITGRVACTASAVMTLLSERTAPRAME